MPKEIIVTHKSGLNRVPIGTGAFYLVKNKIDQSFDLKKNAYYFKRDPLALENIEINSGGLKNLTPRLPYLDLISFHVVEDHVLRVKNFLSGISDILIPNGVELDQLVITGDEFYLRSEYINRFQLDYQKGLDKRYLIFNQYRPHLKSLSFRKTIAQLISNLAESSPTNNYSNVYEVLPDSISGSTESIPESTKTLNTAQFKELRNMAKIELAETKGYPILIYSKNSLGAQSLALAIHGELKKNGFRIAIRELSQAKFQTYFTNGNYDLAILDWKSSYADAEEYFALSYHFDKTVRQNITGFNNPIYNKLYERAYGIADSNVRFKLFKQMQQILTDEVPLIPLELPPQILLSQKLIKNINLHPIDTVVLKYLDLQEPIEGP